MLGFSWIASLGLTAAAGLVGWRIGRARGAAPSPADAAMPVPDSRHLATVTHELRTPVSGMLGMAGLLLETRLDPEQTTYAEAIRSSGEALMSLVDDILDLAAAEAGKGTPRLVAFAPEALVEQVVELLAPRAQAKDLDIAGHVAPSVPARLVGDLGRIRQILFNLAGNAVKYTGHGGIGIRLDAEAGMVTFAVHDTGPGLPPSVLARLFAPFERGAAAADTAGTGLGLSIARRLAEGLGGRIEVTSTVGAGSRFAAVLPLSAAEPLPEVARPMLRAGTRVLVASAAPFGGPWMTEALETAGAACRHEPALAGAERAVDGGAWSFMLLDRGLGEATVDLAARARAQGIRTVALLEPRERRAFDRLQARGFDHFLVKPVRAGSLLAILAAPSAFHRRPQPSVAARRLPRALVAEDEAVNALLARAHLGRLGYAVARVDDGAEAVAAFTEALAEGDGFALVLLDLRLPGLDGFAVARRLRAAELERQASPTLIVALTANDGAAEKRAALDAGMDAFLGKPLDREALARLVADRPIAAAG